MYNPWEDEPEYDEGDLVDMAYDAQRDRRLEEKYAMQITHGHPAQEAQKEEEVCAI
jgi:hypothetical protein